jgi:hypothetical protein
MKPVLLAILLLAVVALALSRPSGLGLEGVMASRAGWVSAVGVAVPTFIAGLLWRETRAPRGGSHE